MIPAGALYGGLLLYTQTGAAMSLAASINRHNTGNGLSAVLIRLDADKREDLLTAVQAPVTEISHMAIVRGLREHGIDVTEASVRRWRERMKVVDGL